MIVIELNGGLGNQMFQYAAARALQQDTKLPLYLDTSILDYELIGRGYTKRRFEIPIFPNSLTRKYPRSILKIGNEYSKLSALQFKLSKQIDRLVKGFKTLREEELLSVKDGELSATNIKLEGYFQSEEYFSSAANVISHDFTFPAIRDGKNRTAAELISSTNNTVSVHVRRSDYLTAVHKNNHPVCLVEYYEKALTFVRNEVGTVRCVVFSDDIEWAKENLQFLGNDTVFVNHNTGANAFEDMRLMSLCTHNIIANSSFSWWGAWLNDNSKKIVVAPERWFGKGKERQNAMIVPDRWSRM